MFRIPSSYWGRNVSFQLERFLGNKPKKTKKKKPTRNINSVPMQQILHSVDFGEIN